MDSGAGGAGLKVGGFYSAAFAEKITVKNIGLTEKQKSLVRLGLDDNNKVIFITGGVVSSLGKGLTAASLATNLQSRGFKIISIKDTTPMPHNGSRPPKRRRV